MICSSTIYVYSNSEYVITDESAFSNEVPFFKSILDFVTNPIEYMTAADIPENDGFHNNRLVQLTETPLSRSRFVHLTMHVGLENKEVLPVLNGMNPLEVVEFFGLSSFFAREALKRVSWTSMKSFLPTMDAKELDYMLELARCPSEDLSHTFDEGKAVSLLSFVRSGLLLYSQGDTTNGLGIPVVTIADVQLMVKMQLYLKEVFRNKAFLNYASTLTPWQYIHYLGLWGVFDPALAEYGWVDLTDLWGYIPCLETAFDKYYGLEQLAPIIQAYYENFFSADLNALLEQNPQVTRQREEDLDSNTYYSASLHTNSDTPDTETHRHIAPSPTSLWASSYNRGVTSSNLDLENRSSTLLGLDDDTCYSISRQLKAELLEIHGHHCLALYPSSQWAFLVDRGSPLSEIDPEDGRCSPPPGLEFVSRQHQDFAS